MATSPTKATHQHPPTTDRTPKFTQAFAKIKPVPARDNAKKTDWFIHLWIWITQQALFCVSSVQ
jgi:hypothetical protein